MVKRHRTIPSAPVQSARQAWLQIAELLARTLATAPGVDQAEVSQELSHLSTLGPMLVSAGHLDGNPLTLVAMPLHLAVNTASGEAAFKLEAITGTVTGASSATSWELWLPEAGPMSAWVEEAATGHPRLKIGQPPDPDAATGRDETSKLFDMEAFRRAQERPR
jgi:hypothetical protein